MNIGERISAMIKIHEKWKWRYWYLHGFFLISSIVLTLTIPILIGLSAVLTISFNLNALVMILSGCAIIFQIIDLVARFIDRYRYHNNCLKEFKKLELQRETKQIDDIEATKRFENILVNIPDEPV